MASSNCFAATLVLVGCFAAVASSTFDAPALGQEWSSLPSIPDTEGYAGAFAGRIGGALLVAGGANFPEKKPWEGGKKLWYDRVYLLEENAAEWTLAGELPRRLGYGVSVTHDDGVVCVGGSDAKRHYADAFRLEWTDGKLVTTPLPPLPFPVANACGAVVGETLYIAGGQEQPDSRAALKSLWSIDLSAATLAWKRLDDLPGEGRILPVAASSGGALYVAGGAALIEGENGAVERRYLLDAYRYEPDSGWKRIADLPWPTVAAPSPAPSDDDGLYVLGGDDGSQVEVEPEAHRGFSKAVLRYDAKRDAWSEAGEIPFPAVTAPCVDGGDRWIVVSGEIRPGVRTPRVVTFRPGEAP